MSYEKTFDEVTDKSVKKYVDEIVKYIDSQEDFTGQVEVEFHEALNKDETHSASFGVITTKFGVVNILPNFNEKVAYATVVNLGLMKAMEKEGFEEDYILTEGKIYGTLMKYSKENVKLFGIYLSQKMDFS